MGDALRACLFCILHFAFCIQNAARRRRFESVERLLSRILFRLAAVEIIHLPLALPRWSSNLPGGLNGNGRFHCLPIWSCSAGGLPSRSRSRGPRCALTAPFHPCLRLLRDSSAVCSLLHFPSRRRAWTLSSLLPVGVRTFLCFRSDPRSAPHA